jgi:cephalosporin hydroxylase
MDKLEVDLRAGTVTAITGDEHVSFPIQSAEAFAAVSKAWLRAGWDTKYVYSFTWMGRPVIQLPEDLIRLQEVIWQLRPDVVIETGVAHGGSLVFYAALLDVIGTGTVVGVDIEIRPHNRRAIEEHALASRIHLIEGGSTDDEVVARVREHAEGARCVLVLLDSNHTRDHVRAELEAYAPLVTKDSYIVAMDGIMREVAGAPRTSPDWKWDNPLSAIDDFLASHPEFAETEPPWEFNEGAVRDRVTYWPRAYLQRIS